MDNSYNKGTGLIENKLIKVVVLEKLVISKQCNDGIYKSKGEQVDVKFGAVFLLELRGFLGKDHRQDDANRHQNKCDDQQLRVE